MSPSRPVIITLLLVTLVGCGGIAAVTIPRLLSVLGTAEPTSPRATGAVEEHARTPVDPGQSNPAPKVDSVNNEYKSNTMRLLGLWVAGWTLFGGIAAITTAGVLVRRRLARRQLRDYRLYEIHLSMHDQAKPQDLEALAEGIANTIREFPGDRARNGQPFIAVELHFGPGPAGDLEWTLAVRCESEMAPAIDGLLSAVYPDVRLGHGHGGAPEPLVGRLPVPGHVLRYRKARSFVYALNSEPDGRQRSPQIESIAAAQVALGRPSSVRIQLTPTPSSIEDFARACFRRHENALARSESWGAPEAGLRGSLNQQEMTEAKRTQNRSMFWMEIQVAAATREDANRVGAALQAVRADNRLHRRWMVSRRRIELYRRRFPSAYPPLWPSPSLRTLASSAEVAHLLELPSARMKGVPVRRVSLPRLPAPPDVQRGSGELLEPPSTAAEGQ
jgi:hypothetical protein